MSLGDVEVAKHVNGPWLTPRQGRKRIKKAQPGFTPDLRPSSASKESYCEDGDLEYDERCCTWPNNGVSVACHCWNRGIEKASRREEDGRRFSSTILVSMPHQ